MGVYRTLPGSTRVESNGSDISWVGQDFWVVLLLGSLFGFSLTTGSHSFFFIECDGVSENGLGFFGGGGIQQTLLGFYGGLDVLYVDLQV